MKQHIPSLLTLGNLICGFAAIQYGDEDLAAKLILLSFVFDGLDGLAARALNVASDFGRQLDSLADVVSFGVAPAYIYALLTPDPTNWMCKIVPWLIVIAGTIRLAYFNVSEPKNYFRGLPIPANALFYIGLIMAFKSGSEYFNDLYNSPTVYILTPILLSALMLMFDVRMISLKSMSKNWTENIYHYLIALVSIILFVMYGYESIPFIVISYVLISIVYTAQAFITEKS